MQKDVNDNQQKDNNEQKSWGYFDSKLYHSVLSASCLSQINTAMAILFHVWLHCPNIKSEINPD